MAVDLEKILRPIDNPAPPFPPKYMMLAGGEEMVIRQVTREEIPDILRHVEPLIHVERDYYDVVAARLYSELLATIGIEFRTNMCWSPKLTGSSSPSSMAAC